MHMESGPEALCENVEKGSDCHSPALPFISLKNSLFSLLSSVGTRYGREEVRSPQVLLCQGSDKIRKQRLREFIKLELEGGL